MADFICHGQLDTKLLFPKKFVVILQQIKQRGSLEGKKHFLVINWWFKFCSLVDLNSNQIYETHGGWLLKNIKKRRHINVEIIKVNSSIS